MSINVIKRLFMLSVLAAMMVTACGGAATEEPVPTEPPAITELKMAGVLATSIENPWDLSFIESFNRVAEQKPHGLTLSLDYTENVWEDVELVMREYADTGEYGIIWGHSSYADTVKTIKDDYPDILFVFVGSGNEAVGGNGLWDYKRIHEPAYLEGMIAGMMTETNVIGAVATFPFDDVNDVINAFIDGAKSVNPEIKAKVSFIESWYDPVKAAEATFAQIAAGADFILQLGEAYEACEEKGVYCFGNYMDSNYLAPDTIITSQVAYWDSDIQYAIDLWWNHVANGEPYDAPMEAIWFPMKDGGAGLAPYHGFEDILPQEVLDAVDEKMQEIMDGTFEVELKVETPVSD
jgi:basic membrane lipoprotein Med (substrate-binding protein (PBP1-ABC) superfamily)